MILPYQVLTDGATVVQSSRTNKHTDHLPKNSSNEILLHTCMISNLQSEATYPVRQIPQTQKFQHHPSGSASCRNATPLIAGSHPAASWDDLDAAHSSRRRRVVDGELAASEAAGIRRILRLSEEGLGVTDDALDQLLVGEEGESGEL